MKNIFLEASAKERIFYIILLITLITPIILIIETYFLGYAFHHNIKWILTLLLAIVGSYLYTIPRYRNKIQLFYFFIMILFLLPLSWFYSGLNNHFTLAYVFIILIAISYFFMGRLRIFFVGLLIFVSTLMLELEVFRPDLFTMMPPSQLKIDILIQTPLTIILASSMLVTFANALHSKNIQLDKLSKLDSLTGVYNRRFIYKHLDTIKKNGQNKSYLIGIFDIDNFKAINDTHGHIYGDKAICALAHHLQVTIGKQGIIGRLGGDEFIAVIQNDKSFLTKEFKKRLQDTKKSFESLDKVSAINFSGGFSLMEKDDSIDACIAKADANMYRAKKEGKNLIIH